MQTEQVLPVKYIGLGDLTIWLEDCNDGQNPLTIPLWPKEFPKRLAVYACESGEVGVAMTREAMLQVCRKLLDQEPTLWFCNIPLVLFLAATDADPKRFS